MNVAREATILGKFIEVRKRPRKMSGQNAAISGWISNEFVPWSQWRGSSLSIAVTAANDKFLGFENALQE